MKASFVFNLPAPALKASTVQEYLAGLQAWKDTIARLVVLYPGLMVESTAPPVMAAERVYPAPPRPAVQVGRERELRDAYREKYGKVFTMKGREGEPLEALEALEAAGWPSGESVEGEEESPSAPPVMPSDAEIEGLH